MRRHELAIRHLWEYQVGPDLGPTSGLLVSLEGAAPVELKVDDREQQDVGDPKYDARSDQTVAATIPAADQEMREQSERTQICESHEREDDPQQDALMTRTLSRSAGWSNSDQGRE